VTFHDTHERLLAHLRERVRNGELTERALARKLGISQPHVNNVLRGRRKLSQEVADLLLNFFHVSLLDLYCDGELRTNLRARLPDGCGPGSAPVLKNAIGPGKNWLGTMDGGRRYYWPSASAGTATAVFARLLPEAGMRVTLSCCDMALLDTSIAARIADAPDGVFVINRGSDTLVRWIRGGFRALYLADEVNLDQPRQWEKLPMVESERPEFVKARVLWLGAESSLRQR